MKFSCTTGYKLVALLVLLLSATESSAQVSSLSPYSRFGIGQLIPQNNPMSIGLSGATTAWYDPLSVNTQNPATYAYTLSTAFDIGLKASMLQLKNSEETQSLNSASINNLTFVFKKIGAKWALAAGLAPYSTTGYSITDTQQDTLVGEVNYTYDGQGGVNRAFLGTSYNFIIRTDKPLMSERAGKDSSTVYHNITIGSNMNFTFGSIEQERRILYSDPSFDHFRVSSSTSVRDLGFDFGMHSRWKLAEKESAKVSRTLRLNIGAVYALGQDINTSFEEVGETLNITAGTEFVLDTVSFISDPDGSISLPSKISLGAALEITNERKVDGKTKKRSIILSGDYKQQDWSSYAEEASGIAIGGTLGNATDLAVGFQYTPRVLDADNVLQRSNYRLGYRVSNSYLVVNDQQIEETAVSAGFSALLGRSESLSKINLGIEFGTRGTTDLNLIEENFVNLYIGFTFVPAIRNRWFVQRKYD